jgi:hypothetical protein
MTVDQGISLAASIGACMSALAAFFAVRLSSKHSKSSYKPELVISQASFKCSSDKYIPSEWVNANIVSKDENTNIGFFSLPLNNVGLGAAKQISIVWSFAIEDVISQINNITKESLIPAYFKHEKGILAFKSEDMGESISMWDNQKNKNLDFVLPAPIDQLPTKLEIPPAFCQLTSALIYFSTQNESIKNFPDMPSLYAEMSYFDIGGTKHTSNFILQVNISMIMKKGKEFQGYVVSKNA